MHRQAHEPTPLQPDHRTSEPRGGRVRETTSDDAQWACTSRRCQRAVWWPTDWLEQPGPSLAIYFTPCWRCPEMCGWGERSTAANVLGWLFENRDIWRDFRS